jgi:EAL domain-containing protein (putative c-di-GMP-specific phosphodiesterase class I)/transposase-like protein
MFIMGSKRREFTPEYKDEAVKLVINTGRPVAVVARELGIVEQTLGNWVKAYRARHEAGDEALTEAERVELLRLRKEVAELKMDRAFLIVAANESHGPGDLLREAGAAMRRAKGQGGNRVSRFEISHSRKVSGLLDMEQALERGLVREEFVLFYQPIYSIADGSLHGVEALVRWERPDHGLVPPNEFIPLAEETGLIVPLGAWVLDEALRQLRVWKSAGIVPGDFNVSVNLSPVQLADPGLVDTIKRMLVEHNLVHSDLTLEMTETALIADRSMMTEIVTSLAEAGASLSIDDFGTGYSSLSNLRYLPAKQLKVDRSFVSGLTTNGRDAALVAAVVGLAHEFGMTCVADGVETREQLERLHRLGCDFAQGHLLGRPSPAADLTQAWQAEHEGKVT